ncbi:hypothetical protein DS885_03820 [Psychromonas sp. B3M02]|uniref:PFGI-1 class ICE element type IV pilus protein PilL2 n=1 Tax=Psychromonas sp. B3M02 TaxID=2267226 RepID=UPI000DE94C56|nr:hypothetical protein [Psychromonas sp. B3M02]RBW47284.1 hypothetical protein DS885_03820 [Psychromonas sp. B3M02]
MKALIPILVMVLFFLPKTNANEYKQLGRYTNVSITPTQQQLNPLLVVVDFEFPPQITKVGEALKLLIAPSGYRFSLSDNDISYILFEMPLPEIHKKLGVMTLDDAIKTLSGSGFTPVYDEGLRLLSFKSSSKSINTVNVALYKKSWLRNKTAITPIANNYKKIVTYTVKSGDSISKILINLGIGYNPKIINHIVDTNPSAFINNNPNHLISGSVIGVPLS